MASQGWGGKTTHCWREIINKEKRKHDKWNSKLDATYDSEASAAAGWKYDWLDHRDSFGLPHYCFLTKRDPLPTSTHGSLGMEEEGAEMLGKGSARGKPPPPNSLALGVRNTPGTMPEFQAMTGELSPGHTLSKSTGGLGGSATSLPPLEPNSFMSPQHMGLTFTAPKGVPSVRTPRGRIAQASQHRDLYAGDNHPSEQRRGRTRHNQIHNIITHCNGLQHNWKTQWEQKSTKSLGGSGPPFPDTMMSKASSLNNTCSAAESGKLLAEAANELKSMSKTVNFYKGGNGITLNNSSLLPI